METIYENLFDLLLRRFLTPKEAVCLAGVSRSLRALAEGSLRWKVWGEQACPALKTFPARELVSAHFEKANRGPGFYRDLFLELSTERRSLVQLPLVFEQNAGQCEEWALKSPNVGDFLMLMDVFLGGECILSCSAGAQTLSCAEREMADTESGVKRDLEEFKWGTLFSSRTPFEGSQAASEASLDSFAVKSHGRLTESLPQLSLNWRLLRKSDMRLLTLPILVQVSESFSDVENLVMYARFCAYPVLWAVATKLSKVGAPWRTYRFSRWLQLEAYCKGDSDGRVLQVKRRWLVGKGH
jgi:hypothetical protein